MLDAKPASHPRHRLPPVPRREVARAVGACTVATLATGVVIADLEHPHITAGAAVSLLGAWLAQALIAQRRRRVDATHAGHGLDPQVIAAARRISHRLARQNQHDWRS
ncbi:hypothetical protein ACQEVZ_20360 [Dactylosporangium sp. CA-152071]|uniref:hypothetical protein n=1 Tax=Dactylosporangium sp. CA-152071 TaxID=3239933 RepID=UPI003D8DD95C